MRLRVTGALLALALTGLAHFALTRTVFGRHTVAVGTNEEAARLVGGSGAVTGRRISGSMAVMPAPGLRSGGRT